MQRLYREEEELMSRRHVLAVLLAASVTLAAACGAQVRESGGGGESQGGGGGQGENAPVQLAVVPKAIGFDFWEQVRLGAECAAQKASGQVDIQWDGVTAETEQVPDLIAKELGEEGGEVAFIPFQQGTLTNEQREEGFKNGLKQHPELELVAEQSSQSDYNKALQVTEDMLTANPDLDAIFAANEPGVLGAAEAVRQAGKAGDIVIIGWDASPEEIQGVEDGVISALVVQNPFRMGYDGTNAAIDIIRTGAKVESEDTGSTIVTKDNLEDPKVQSVLNPSCENPPV